MAVYTQEIATDIILTNITVYRKYRDGVLCGYEVYTNEGYVMYDTTANNTEVDPETWEEYPVIYYYTWLSCPVRTNFDTFTWIAVPRSSVDENYIFGVDDHKHEVV